MQLSLFCSAETARVWQSAGKCTAWRPTCAACWVCLLLQWWMWEVVVLLAGLLPDAEVAVAVTGLSTQIQTIPWIMCYSLGTATSTRVAQALGAGDAARAARLFRWVVVCICEVPAAWCGRSCIAFCQQVQCSRQLQRKHL